MTTTNTKNADEERRLKNRRPFSRKRITLASKFVLVTLAFAALADISNKYLGPGSALGAVLICLSAVSGLFAVAASGLVDHRLEKAIANEDNADEDMDSEVDADGTKKVRIISDGP